MKKKKGFENGKEHLDPSRKASSKDEDQSSKEMSNHFERLLDECANEYLKNELSSIVKRL